MQDEQEDQETSDKEQKLPPYSGHPVRKNIANELVIRYKLESHKLIRDTEKMRMKRQ